MVFICDFIHVIFLTTQVGSAMKLTNKNVWKIDDNVESAWKIDNDDEIIDSDQLLDENDLKKPDPSSLRG